MQRTNILKPLFLLVFITTGANAQEVATFKDCDTCPEMVVIPPGSVYIGSYEEEIGRKRGERARVEATIEQSFAIAQTEVTLASYRQFVIETNHQPNKAFYNDKELIGCNYFDGKSYGYIAKHNWENPGYPQREDAPVVCVSWSDAAAYAKWLTEKTGRNYRVPSTVEFEYASRAGSSAPWYWGTDPAQACDYANVGDQTFSNQFPQRPTFPCDDGYVFTASVKKFKPNAFGLYDMVGNAWEWTNDCFANDLTEAPVDGSSWAEDGPGECIYRTPKGGSWISGIGWSRAGVRSRDGADYRSFMLGFRVAAAVD